MSRGALMAAWVGSVAPGVLAALHPDWSLGHASQLGWALVPWIALAGLPAWGSPALATRPVVSGGLALPPLALAAALDHASGAGWGELAALAGAGLALISLLALAAERGRARPRTHALVWLLLVPGTALCAWSLALGGAPWSNLEALAGLSPLTWALGRAAGGAEAELFGLLGPLGGAALCLLASSRGRA